MIKPLEVGVLYEADDGTFGLCTQSAVGLKKEVLFGLAFVAPHGEEKPMTFRVYKEDGTNDGNPTITKELWRLP